MDTLKSANEKTMMRVIGVLSVAIPLVVAVLLFKPPTENFLDFNVYFLPKLNAILNTGTTLCLLVGFFAIKQKNIALHRTMMVSAVALSAIFLISYVLYHANSTSTPFGGEGTIRYVYFFILLTHILLAIVVVPLVLLAVYYALSDKIERHKKIVKWTYPVWLYVAVTGVVVYLMISPYYPTGV